MPDEENRDWIAEDALEDWVSPSGVRCVVRAGGFSLCGYARLPDSLVGKCANYNEIDVALPYGVKLTYGPPDKPYWVGFDTGHAGETWAPDDLIGQLTEEGFKTAQELRRIYENQRAIPSHRWTRQELHDATEVLGRHIAALAALAEACDTSATLARVRALAGETLEGPTPGTPT